MAERYFVLLWWHYVVAGLSSPYGRLTEIVIGDRVKWSWEVTCCHFILSLHSAGGGTWAMTGCCDNVWDLLTSVNDPDHYIRMDYVGHPDVSWKPSGCSMLTSVVWTSLRRSGYEVKVVRMSFVYKCRSNFLEVVRIWKARHVYPDEGDPDGSACHVSPWGAWHVFSGGGVPTNMTTYFLGNEARKV